MKDKNIAGYWWRGVNVFICHHCAEGEWDPNEGYEHMIDVITWEKLSTKYHRDCHCCDRVRKYWF